MLWGYEATHPFADRKGSHTVPGWNSSNYEISASGRHGCYLLFDREGRLAFRGRASFEEIEERVEALLRRR